MLHDSLLPSSFSARSSRRREVLPVSRSLRTGVVAIAALDEIIQHEYSDRRDQKRLVPSQAFDGRSQTLVGPDFAR